jgi:mannose-6-phosphate isomerase
MSPAVAFAHPGACILREMIPDLARPLRPVPSASPRPWAGTRLGPGIGERWLAGPASVVTIGDGFTPTLDELAAAWGPSLVGTRGLERMGARFPLLVKVIDAAEWLSLQVHPTDELARRLYGPDAVGKAEAWVVLDADPGARLVTGPRHDLGPDALLASIRAGTMGQAECESAEARPGDVLNLRAGTIHAIGAGTFVFEIEQPSDLTFRISDWGRPATAARPLHVAEALEAVDPSFQAEPDGTGWRLAGGALDTPHFRLEIAGASDGGDRAPAGRTLEIVTAYGGTVIVEGDGWRDALEPLDTIVVPAAVAAYRVAPGQGAHALIGSLPA